MSVNFCTSCKVVLANEEVVNGVCERCGSEVVHKVKSQWMLKITEYADRLIDDLADLDFIERDKTNEINWIRAEATVRRSTSVPPPEIRSPCIQRDLIRFSAQHIW